MCVLVALCSSNKEFFGSCLMPSPPRVPPPPPFFRIPEGVGRLDALQFTRPYPVFDIHHVVDCLNEEQTWNLRCGLEFYGLPWGICSFGPGKIWRWVDDINLRPLLAGAAFVAVTMERSYRSGEVEQHYQSRPWRDQCICLEVEFHRAYRELDRPWIPYAHAIVVGNKGDVARILSGPSVLFDDRRDNCVDWCVDGHELNRAICVDAPHRAVFEHRPMLPEERLPTYYGTLSADPLRGRVRRAEHVNRWLHDIVEFAQGAEAEIELRDRGNTQP